VRAGLLRHKVDIQSNGETVDSFGGVVSGWSDVVTDYPATVTPLRGVERDSQGRVESDVTHKVTIRYASVVAALTTSHRVVYGSRVFDIKSVVNVGERNVMIELMCVEHG